MSKYPEGVIIKKLTPHYDRRGYVTEIMRTDWKEFFTEEIKQTNLSVSHPGVIRAWHRHKRGQVDYMTCIEGRIKVWIKDKDGKIFSYLLMSSSPDIIRIPGHYWHGIEAIGKNDAILIYFTTKLYDYDNPDEEREDFK